MSKTVTPGWKGKPVAMGDGEYTASFTVRKSTEEKATAYYADPARQASYEKNKKAYDAALATWTANGERNAGIKAD